MFEISKAIIKQNNKYLLLKRASHSKTFPDTWDFAGGKFDKGETPIEALIRETKEETNFDIEKAEELFQLMYKDNNHHLLLHYFKPIHLEGNFKLSHEHSIYNWFSEKEIKKLDLHPSVILYFEKRNSNSP